MECNVSVVSNLIVYLLPMWLSSHWDFSETVWSMCCKWNWVRWYGMAGWICNLSLGTCLFFWLPLVVHIRMTKDWWYVCSGSGYGEIFRTSFGWDDLLLITPLTYLFHFILLWCLCNPKIMGSSTYLGQWTWSIYYITHYPTSLLITRCDSSSFWITPDHWKCLCSLYTFTTWWGYYFLMIWYVCSTPYFIVTYNWC